MKNIRWYDKNPDLKELFSFIEDLNEDMQCEIAQCIMQILVKEFNFDLDEETTKLSDDYNNINNKRWYDNNIDLFSAFELIKSLSIDIQEAVISKIVIALHRMINNTKTKNVLVTGASKGIGRKIAETLTKSGYNVFATARNEQALKSLDVKNYCVCDITKDIQPLNDFINANQIDILINNAGEYIYSPIDEVTENMINSIFATNLLAPTQLCALVSHYMKQNHWGRIINIGSISGVMGEANASLYSASKAGLIGLTKALALELAEYNITVNTLNPGWVETELASESIEQSNFDENEIVDIIPQKRFIEPIEIANFIKYLISEDAKGVTGQSINLCAGLSVGF